MVSNQVETVGSIINIHFTSRLYKGIGCDGLTALFSLVELLNPHSVQQAHVESIVGVHGGVCSFIVFGLLYCTLDIKLNVP